MGVSLSVYVSETKWKKKKERKKGDVSATALANGWKKSGWKTPATPNSKCAIIQTYKCKNICMYSYIVRSANEYKCKKHHYDKQTHKKMQKPLSFWRPEKFIYTRIHNLFCFVDLFIIESTLHTHIVVWWACMCVHIGARQCLLRFATVIMMIALVSVQSASVCVCVCVCFSCRNLAFGPWNKSFESKTADKYFYLTVFVGDVLSTHTSIHSYVNRHALVWESALQLTVAVKQQQKTKSVEN